MEEEEEEGEGGGERHKDQRLHRFVIKTLWGTPNLASLISA